MVGQGRGGDLRWHAGRTQGSECQHGSLMVTAHDGRSPNEDHVGLWSGNCRVVSHTQEYSQENLEGGVSQRQAESER